MAIDGKPRNCPTCAKPLRILEKSPLRMLDGGGSQINVPLASWAYECDEHGRFIIDIAGNTWGPPPN